MAAINTPNGKSGKKTIAVDLTPMVDLGFLLITFFVITTNLQEQKVTKLNLPSHGDSTAITASSAITLQLLGNNEIRYYFGDQANAATITGYGPNQLRRVLLQFKQQVPAKQHPQVVITPTYDATYQNLVDVLDEMAIHRIDRYAVTDAIASLQ